ncbi:hypothetical protein SLS62_008496 [Diatrype stigma]|uniref:NADP-dependent oxidoreductase domain-containing protein n=1 Tax=Diatrype stigma TaxID=117547 RepID=A0AAN9ULB8_9PEZI
MSALSIKSSFKLNSGYEMPLLGFGVYQTPQAEAERCCLEAFAAGYRHVDSAAAYQNEAACGAAIRASGLPRSEIFFTTKVPPGAKGMGYEAASAVVDESLRKSGLDYIDLFLVHAPYGGPAARKGAWRALFEAVDAGKVRSIGVSNYGLHHLEELEGYIREERDAGRGGGVVSVAQYEVHPWCARKDVAAWCKARNVALEAYCPVVRGARWGDATLAALAAKYGKTQAQVLIRWSLQKGYVPLPKSVTPARIRENAGVYDFELTPEEVDELETDEYAPIAWDPTKASLED